MIEQGETVMQIWITMLDTDCCAIYASQSSFGAPEVVEIVPTILPTELIDLLQMLVPSNCS